MDVEFFIHGVPDGNDFFGLAEDRMYFDSFYSGEAENRLLIQTRISGGKLYCYYNYLIGKNVISYSGRQGSYFGITLRLDQYCIDFSKIYRLLDTAYSLFCVNTLLEQTGSNTKYLVSNFKSAKNQTDRIETKVIGLLQDGFSGNDFTALDKTFNSNSANSTLLKRNLLDCTVENVMSAVKQSGKIAISLSYPSQREKSLTRQYEQKINALKTEYGQQINSIKESYNSEKTRTDSELQQLKSTLKQREEENRQLYKEKQDLESRIREFKQIKRIDELIAPIKGPIALLAEEIQRLSPSKTRIERDGNARPAPASKCGIRERLKGKWLFLLTVALAVIVAIAIGISLMCGIFNKDNDSTKDKTKTYYQTEQPFINNNTESETDTTQHDNDTTDIQNGWE